MVTGQSTSGHHNDPMRTVVELGAADAAHASIETRFVDPVAPTVIAFAGMGHGLQMPIVEFAGVLAPLAVNVVFVKDLRQCWYQRGVRGLGDSPAESADALREIVPAGSRLVGTIGTSSGGTGAILFATILQAPGCLAFSPRTLVDADAVDRWRVDVPDMPELDLGSATADLRRFLTEHPHGPISVQYGAGNPQDMAQAERLADLPGVDVTTLPTDWHPSAAWLRERGALGRTVADAFGLRLLPGRDFSDALPRAAVPTRDWRPAPLWRAVRSRLAGTPRPTG